MTTFDLCACTQVHVHPYTCPHEQVLTCKLHETLKINFKEIRERNRDCVYMCVCACTLLCQSEHWRSEDNLV